MKIEKLILIIICAFVVTGCNKSITENEVASVDNTIMTDAGVEVENVETVTQSENVKDFDAHLEDVNFDGQDDLIIALGSNGAMYGATYCAYLYTDKCCCFCCCEFFTCIRE